MKAKDELARLKRRLANARKRAAFWSGRPSSTAKSFKPTSYRSRLEGADMEYEIAMTDMESLATAIAKLTGKKPVVTDYKREFNDRYFKTIGKALVKEPTR